MALVEKISMKIEIDENNGSHIQIRKTTHLVDSVTGKVIYGNIKHHRKVIMVGDDAGAIAEKVDHISNVVWTQEIRDKEAAKITAQK